MLFIQEQFRWLLEYLLTRLTSGATLELSFMDAAKILQPLLSKNSELLFGLRLIEKQLTARQPLDQLLPNLGQYLPCPDAQICFQILPGLRKAGGQVSQFIRQQLQITTKTIALQHDMNAENAQRQTEALILSVMPFGMAIMLKSSTTQEISNQNFTMIGSILAYALAMLAVILTINFIATKNVKSDISLSLKRAAGQMRCYFKKPIHFLIRIYQDILPEQYGLRLLQILREYPESERGDKQVPITIYFERKVKLFLIGLFPAIILLSISKNYWYLGIVISIIPIFIQDQQIFADVRKRQSAYRMDYPIFLNTTAALLQAGLSLHISLKICIRAFTGKAADKKINLISTALLQDLSTIWNQLQIGLPTDKILEKLANCCILPEAQAALLMMARYDQTGSQEILQLLQMQASNCWSLHYNAKRKQLEKQSMKLLLPMTLDLAAVMLTAILPAIISLQAI